MPPIDINYVAVVVSALVAFFVGAVWYSPVLFAKAWMSAHGYTSDKLDEMKQGMTRAYIVSFLSYVVMALVMGALVSWSGASTAGHGLRLGLYVWVGFAATIGLTNVLFSDRKFATYLIDAGYQLVILLLMGLIMAIWN